MPRCLGLLRRVDVHGRPVDDDLPRVGANARPRGSSSASIFPRRSHRRARALHRRRGSAKRPKVRARRESSWRCRASRGDADSLRRLRRRLRIRADGNLHQRRRCLAAQSNRESTSIVVEPICAGYWIASPYISPAAIARARLRRRIVADDRDLAGLARRA